MNILSLDTEHSKDIYYPWQDGFYLTCVGLVTNKRDLNKQKISDIIWFDHCEEERTENGIQLIQDAIDWADLILIQNAKHDINVLTYFGVDFKDTPIHCTMVTEYLVRGQDKTMEWNLNAVANNYNLELKLDEVKAYWDNGVDTFDIPSYKLGPYCIQDCRMLLNIFEYQKEEIKKRGLKRVVDLQNEYTYLLSEMECNGLKLDKEKVNFFVKKYEDLANISVNKIKDIVNLPDINISSSQQLSALLYGGKLKLSHTEWVIRECKTKPYSYYNEKIIIDEIDYPGIGFKPIGKKLDNGYYSTEKSTITSLTAPTKQLKEIKKLLRDYSKNIKVVESLVGKKRNKGLLNKIQPDGLLHPKFNQTVTSNGRLSSSDPNGQNLPRGSTSPLKQCIVPTLDKIGQIDASQMEWRDAAYLSQDRVMIYEINSGIDQHAATVKELMELEFISKNDPKSNLRRFHAKTFNFRMIFGGSKWGYFLDPNMPNFTLKKWQRTINSFWKKYYGLNEFHNRNIKFVFENGYYTLPTGRWFKFHRKLMKDGIPSYKKNEIRNYPISGMSGGDIIPLLGVVIRRGMRKLGLKSKMILTVHDSFVFDYLESEEEKLVKLCYNIVNNLDKYIRNYYKIFWNVKLEGEFEGGNNYGELKYIGG